MKNRYLIIFFIIVVVIGFLFLGYKITNNEKTKLYKVKDNDSNEVIKSMNITINNKEYNIQLENNETVNKFIELLPLEIDMNELNGNEKYVYLNTKLPTNPSNQKRINSGDIMLYGNNCLVIFYKSFDTSYSYTKIGHINNLDNLGSNDIKVIIKSTN